MPAYKIPRYVVIREMKREDWSLGKYPEKIYEGSRKDEALEASKRKHNMRYFIQKIDDRGHVHQEEITRAELKEA